MSKIIKNTTGTDIELQVLGVTVPASGQIQLSVEDYLDLSSDISILELTPLINSGNIVINDGITDLPIVEALAYIEYPDNAKNIRFTNTSNSFVSDDVQDAIEEISNIKDITQTGHGFTLPSFGFLPLYYNAITGDYELASSTEITTASDCVAIGFPDTNTIKIQEGGLIEVTHGLTVGKWYVLSTTPGQIEAYDVSTGSEAKIQYLCFTLDSNTLILRQDPIFIEPFVPRDIEILEDWITGSTTPTLTSGENRLMIVGVSWEEDAGTTVSSIAVGGQTGTLLVQNTITSGFQAGSYTVYFTDSQIEAMINQNITITWTSGAPLDFEEFSAILQFVDQDNPIVATASDSGIGGTDTLDADVNSLAGGYVFLNCATGNEPTTFTNNGTGFTRKLNLTITSTDGVIDDKLISTDATPENVNMSVSNSNRHVLISASFRRKES